MHDLKISKSIEQKRAYTSHETNVTFVKTRASLKSAVGRMHCRLEISVATSKSTVVDVTIIFRWRSSWSDINGPSDDYRFVDDFLNVVFEVFSFYLEESLHCYNQIDQPLIGLVCSDRQPREYPTRRPLDERFDRVAR